MDEDPGRVAFRWLLELRVALVWANCHPYGASCRVVSMTRGENLELIYPTNSGGCRKDKKNADVYLTGTDVVLEEFTFSENSPLTYLFSKTEWRAARKR
jgi:hypothetical protein